MLSNDSAAFCRIQDKQYGAKDRSLWDPIRDLGVVIDSRLSMADHVASICRSAYCHLRQIRPTMQSLSRDAAKAFPCPISSLFSLRKLQLRFSDCIVFVYIQYLKVPGPDYGTDIVDKCLWPTTSTGERWRGLRLCSAYRAYANLNPGLESRKTCSTKVIESDRLLLPGLQIQFRRGVGLTLILDRLTPTVNRIQFLSW